MNKAANKLEQLRTMTEVVADTGDIEAIARFKPTDATTNPSLLLKAAQLPQYEPLIHQAKQWASTLSLSSAEQLAACADKLAVLIGNEILSIVPGRISTEVDARLSFDSAATVEKAKQLIEMYAQLGINQDRILIKIASTWEGIQAAQILEKHGINCNLTLLFSFAQAAASADAGAFLISPFVGRILDWYKAATGETYTAENDPGVRSVSHIYRYYKQHNYHTVVMGASFRNVGEIEQLAGCDRLTISPMLMEELSSDTSTLTRQLAPNNLGDGLSKRDIQEADFRWQLNDNAMATEKLAEGIRNFTQDQIKLEQMLKS